jgi:hypothetical protein
VIADTYNLGTKIFVGVSSSYARREDVIVQTRLSNPDIAVAQSLGEMVSQIEDWYSLQIKEKK